jgi:methylated-DNA-[protein]-cysteine S-methyltransferase
MAPLKGRRYNFGRNSFMKLVCKFVESPVGRLKLVASEKGLAAIFWEKGNSGGSARLGDAVKDDGQPILVEAERQLKEYFEGKRQSFSIPLDMRGTEFQKSVWKALLGIPFGETRSYGQIAKQIGRPKAMRAVGAANGSNPIPIVVPCHRVIGSSGELTGFGGGLETKARLLEIEGGNGSGGDGKRRRVAKETRNLRLRFE